MFTLEDFQGKSSGIGVFFGILGLGAEICSKHLQDILGNLRTALHDQVRYITPLTQRKLDCM